MVARSGLESQRVAGDPPGLSSSAHEEFAQGRILAVSHRKARGFLTRKREQFRG